MVTQDEIASLAERDDAATQIPDSVVALYWFDLAARQGHTATQYEVERILLSPDPEVHNPKSVLLMLPRCYPQGPRLRLCSIVDARSGLL